MQYHYYLRAVTGSRSCCYTKWSVFLCWDTHTLSYKSHLQVYQACPQDRQWSPFKQPGTGNEANIVWNKQLTPLSTSTARISCFHFICITRSVPLVGKVSIITFRVYLIVIFYIWDMKPGMPPSSESNRIGITASSHGPPQSCCFRGIIGYHWSLSRWHVQHHQLQLHSSR